MPPGVYERKPWMRTYGKAKFKREEIVKMWSEGMSVMEIARKLNFDPRTIRRVKNQGKA